VLFEFAKMSMCNSDKIVEVGNGLHLLCDFKNLFLKYNILPNKTNIESNIVLISGLSALFPKIIVQIKNYFV